MNNENKQPKVRKNLRLKNYDYSSFGSYFVTICTHRKQTTLGHISCSNSPCDRLETNLSELGKIAYDTVFDIADENETIEIANFVVMPNHVHLLINFISPLNDSREGCHYDLSQIVSKYKSLVSNRWLECCKDNNIYMGKVWQRSYYDHIIRNERDFLETWQYIEYNPNKWNMDVYYKQRQVLE